MILRGKLQSCLLLFFLLLLCFQGGQPQNVVIRYPHFPVRGYNHFQSWNVTSGSEGTYVYPSCDNNVTTFDQYEFFVNEINFDDTDTPGNFFIGAKNNLYEMNSNLSVVRRFHWPVSSASYTSCASKSIDTSFACHNHIRVYKKLPQANAANRLWVCGTDAYRPVCKTLDNRDIEDTSNHSMTNVSTNDVGVLSVHPALPALWGFQGDSQILATGFYEANMWNDYDFARYNVSYNPTTKHLEINHDTADRTIQSSDDYHIREPYHPISMYDARLLPTDTDNSGMYLFFFREREFKAQDSAAAPVRSRVIRICKDDRATSARFFGSLLKAEIFCAKQPLGTPEAFGAQTFYYTGLRDTHFGYDDSRWYGNRNVWDRLLYGVFTSEQYAPNGTALCVYYAGIKDFADVSAFLDPNHRGVLEVFNQNHFLPKTGAREANSFLNCRDANDRTQADLLLAESGIQQYKGLYLPLLELPGEVATKVTVDVACIVRFNDTTKCMMQDVLFVGTNVGKIYKIVFTTKRSAYPTEPKLGLDGFSHDPVIAQEWQLADSRGVEQLYLRREGNLRYIYATTYSRVYKFVAYNCERHANCRDCVASRDPYCFWNLNSNKCEFIKLGSDDTADEVAVSSNLLQNVHGGNSSSCPDAPSYCSVSVTPSDPIGFTVEHNCVGTSSVQLTVTSHGCPTLTPIPVFTITGNKQTVNHASILGLHLYKVNFTATYSNFDPFTTESYVTTVGGVPSMPTTSEVIASGMSDNSVQVVVTISGCSLHNVASDHTIYVSFLGANDTFYNFSQPYNGGNTFSAGSFYSCENVTYYVRVTNCYGSSPVYTGFIQPYTSPPDQPGIITVDSFTSDSAAISWVPPSVGSNNNFCNQYTGFSVYINSVKKLDCIDRTSYSLMGLSSYTNYTFQVAACSEGGESTPTSTSVMTACGRPSRVLSLTSEVVSHESLRFEWNRPLIVNGTGPQYTVTEECFNQTTLTNDVSTITSSQTYYVISSLQPRSLCCITVVANATCNSAYYTSEPTMSCAQSSDATPGPIENLNAIPTGPNSVLLTWFPAINYTLSGIMYEIMVTDPSGTVMMHETVKLYFHVTEGLNNDTEYKFCIMGRNEFDDSSEVCMNGTTLPSPPEPPTDVTMVFNDCELTVSWEDPTSDKYSVDSYNVSVQCNRDIRTMVVPASTKSYTFSYCSDSRPLGLVWCAAQVFSENDIGPSALSQWANIVASYNITTPECYLTEDVGHSVTFSYTLTSAYALNNLRVNYSLVTTGENPRVIEVGEFDFNGRNQLTFSNLTRMTPYLFSLRLCDNNINYRNMRCSAPFEKAFNSSSINPDAPYDLKWIYSTFKSVYLSWSPPPNENASNFNYTIRVTGGNMSYSIVPYIILDGLQPETDYTISIQATDIASGISSVFSNFIEVKTLSGRSIPSFFGATYYPENERLTLYWNRPDIWNGTILNYTIMWSSAIIDTTQCESLLSSTSGAGTTDINDEQSFTTTIDKPNGLDINTREFLLCVAASTAAGRGDWNSTIISRDSIITLGLSGGNNNNSSDNLALILVSILAAMAILAAVAIAIIFAILCRLKYYNNSSYGDDDCRDSSPSPNNTNGDVSRVSVMFRGSGKKKVKAKRGTPKRSDTVSQSIKSTTVMIMPDGEEEPSN